MLSKQERLSRSQFSTYFKLGKRFHSDYYTLLVSPAPTFLVSVVVSKKVAKKAHDRNRLKRRLYSILGSLNKDQTLTGAYILIVKPQLAKLTKKVLFTEIAAALAQVINKR
jgi:ribonuclease P protein component